jgi:hypothetical protein
MSLFALVDRDFNREKLDHVACDFTVRHQRFQSPLTIYHKSAGTQYTFRCTPGSRELLSDLFWQGPLDIQNCARRLFMPIDVYQ